MKRFALLCLVFLTGSLLFTPTETFSKEVVSFGLCGKYNPRIMYQLYQPFIDYLNEQTPYQFEIKLSKTYEETIERFGTGKIFIASCGPVPYIKAREKYPVQPILRALSRDRIPFYRGIIIVRQDSPVQALSDLNGRSFAFGEIWSTAGHILPEYHLLKAGVPLKDLKEHSFLRHHDSVVFAVLKGKFDAGAVKDIVAIKYRSEGLRFIYTTDPIPTVPIVVRANAPTELTRSVKAALLKLDPREPGHEKTMARWDEEFKYGFTEASDSDYDPIRKILQEIGGNRKTKGRAQD